jgi:hypothetical protein
MISDEVKMLMNRMRSHPEEFAVDQLNFGADREIRRMRRWDNFMNSLVNRKPDIELILNPEEIEALRQTATEILRPLALGTIVKQIVGGDEEDYPREVQTEMSFEADSSAYVRAGAKHMASAMDIQVAKKLNMELGNYLKMKAGCGL